MSRCMPTNLCSSECFIICSTFRVLAGVASVCVVPTHSTYPENQISNAQAACLTANSRDSQQELPNQEMHHPGRRHCYSWLSICRMIHNFLPKAGREKVWITCLLASWPKFRSKSASSCVSESPLEHNIFLYNQVTHLHRQSPPSTCRRHC